MWASLPPRPFLTALETDCGRYLNAVIRSAWQSNWFPPRTHRGQGAGFFSSVVTRLRRADLLWLVTTLKDLIDIIIHIQWRQQQSLWGKEVAYSLTLWGCWHQPQFQESFPWLLEGGKSGMPRSSPSPPVVRPTRRMFSQEEETTHPVTLSSAQSRSGYVILKQLFNYFYTYPWKYSYVYYIYQYQISNKLYLLLFQK